MLNVPKATDAIHGHGHTLQRWLDEAYKEFAISGPMNLKVDRIARKAGITRTSFYHYFLDKDALVKRLLEIHKNNIHAYLQELQNCNSYVPDVFLLMIKYKNVFLFHKQLGISRNVPEFHRLYLELMEKDSITSKLWADYFNISINDEVAAKTHLFLSESLFNFITPETFDQDSLMRFALLSKTVIRDLIQTCRLKN
jgi:AcrR family transcriptional regulator